MTEQTAIVMDYKTQEMNSPGIAQKLPVHKLIWKLFLALLGLSLYVYLFFQCYKYQTLPSAFIFAIVWWSYLLFVWAKKRVKTKFSRPISSFRRTFLSLGRPRA